MTGRSLRRRTAAVALSLLTGATACGATPSATGSSSGPLQVVAAENFYGDLARQIGGRAVSVTSILSNPDADPHLFQAGARAELKVADAGVVIDNGAGYDDWMGNLLAAAPSSSRHLITVADVLHVHGDDPNPHLWYDAPRLPTVVAAIGSAMAQADPAQAVHFADGVRSTVAHLQPLLTAVRGLRARFAGLPVAYTERVPGLLLQAAGLRVLTPAPFARAVEDGTDPSPRDVATMDQLLTGHRVRVLVYNLQATSTATTRLRQVALDAGVPVVAVTETEPAGSSFLGWQLRQIHSLAAAFSR